MFMDVMLNIVISMVSLIDNENKMMRVTISKFPYLITQLTNKIGTIN
jgi:hypothetical protein